MSGINERIEKNRPTRIVCPNCGGTIFILSMSVVKILTGTISWTDNSEPTITEEEGDSFEQDSEDDSWICYSCGRVMDDEANMILDDIYFDRRR